MDDLSHAHLAWLQAERNVSPATIAARRFVLTDVGNPGTATREEVEAWWETRRYMSRSTRNTDLSHLRMFYKWCLAWEHRTDDPTRRLTAPKKEKTLPRPVSRADLHRVLPVVPDDVRRAVSLGAYAGLRISEAAILDWSNVDQETRRIRVEGSKGLRTRLVGLSPLLLDALLPDTGGNVVTAGGKPHSADTLQRKVNRAIRAAGVDATYHQLRHRFGTMALATSGNLLAVSRAMGHSSPATTAIYAATSDAELDVIAEGVTR